MSLNERLKKLEDQLAGDFPTFDVACKRRWTMPRWFKELSRQADIARVRAEVSAIFEGWPKDDAELRRELAKCPADWQPGLPAGAIPARPDGAPPDAPPLQELSENTMPN